MHKVVVYVLGTYDFHETLDLKYLNILILDNIKCPRKRAALKLWPCIWVSWNTDKRIQTVHPAKIFKEYFSNSYSFLINWFIFLLIKSKYDTHKSVSLKCKLLTTEISFVLHALLFSIFDDVNHITSTWSEYFEMNKCQDVERDWIQCWNTTNKVRK